MRKTCLNLIYELAKKDKRIIYIGSDVGAGTLQNMKEEMPDQFFMEGIQEQNIIGMATGLALSGKIVYVNTIATFITRRCYEQVLLDVSLHNTNVRLLGNSAGLVHAALGSTHIATDDIALMKTIPNMTVIACADADEMTRLMPQTVDYKGPIYIRFAKGGDPIVSKPPFEIGKAIEMRMGKNALIITTGITLKLGLEAGDYLNASVLHIPTIKPLDEAKIIPAIRHHKVVIVVEESIKALGNDIASLVLKYNPTVGFAWLGIPDEFVERYGTQESLMRHYGITAEGVIDYAKRFLC